MHKRTGFNLCSNEERGVRENQQKSVFLSVFKYILKTGIIKVQDMIINMHPFKHSMNVFPCICILSFKVHKYKKVLR